MCCTNRETSLHAPWKPTERRLQSAISSQSNENDSGQSTLSVRLIEVSFGLFGEGFLSRYIVWSVLRISHSPESGRCSCSEIGYYK